MRLIIVLLFSVFSFNVNAQQQYFNKLYDMGYVLTTAKGILEINNNYYVSALGNDYNPWHQIIVIYKINKKGQLLDTLIYKPNDRWLSAYPRNIVRSNDDCFFVNYGEIPTNDSLTEMIMKIDTNLNIKWIRHYHDTLNIPNDPYINFGINNMSSTNDGGLIAVGNINGTGNYHRLFVMKTDSLGTAEWIKYNPTTLGVSYAIKQTPDSGYVYVSTPPKIIKLDKYGNQLWNTSFNINYIQYASHDVVIDKDGNIIAGINEFIIDGDIDGDMKIHLFKFDGNTGQMIWDKEYYFYRTVDNLLVAQHESMGLITLDDGSIIWYGHSIGDVGSNSFAAGAIMKFNTNGDSLWSSLLDMPLYRDSLSMAWGIFDMKPTADNGFVGVGVQVGVGKSMAWVVKLDSMGHDMPGGNGLSVAELNNTSLASLQIYPNPATDQLNIKIPSQYKQHIGQIIVYNSQGKEVDKTNIPKNTETINLNINQLLSGVYLLRLVSGGEFVGGGKFIKQ